MVLGGASLGGGIAMDFAVKHPEAAFETAFGWLAYEAAFGFWDAFQRKC